MKLTTMELESFVASVASSSPAPGGGSVAALSGALGAALTAMVANNALNKKKVDRQAVTGVLERLEPLQTSLVAAVDMDTEAFNLVMKALELPKESPDVRRQALAQATRQATAVPLQVAEHCAEVTEAMLDLTRHARKSLASDLGTGVWALTSALEGAAYNVHINLGGLADEEFALSVQQRLETAQSKAQSNLEVVREWVEKRLV